ncbi:SGNH/GDSL hydrolase family protein [Microlunatus sp. Gsoil 973]|jgi:lysophospholipase L1-like esterase|uniref:SGNH/GDSL hydrolase family protein n=1 Tax=Microlunatus sp. Gsoil 973 TaxID=2672569 RepID=UPI0012B4AEAF|nr:SGNH/GDSL hydrolase family protein [Microlunatus sp. Gsoil 973]QGN33772.1 GDSL family lipase [Microlunatus sp. Gsoil 973]
MTTSSTTLVFFGDSITDAGRRQDPDGLGNGYVRLLAGRLADTTVINAGIGGNRAVDLQARLDSDVLAYRPDLVSIMVGINDTWRRFDSDDPTSTEAYEATYRDLLKRITAAGARSILLEPFVVPVTEEQATLWRDDLQPRIDAVHQLGAEFDAPVIPLDVELNKIADEVGAAALAEDGVHPTERGHAEIARLWLEVQQAG